MTSSTQFSSASNSLPPMRSRLSAWRADSPAPIRCRRSGTICAAARSRSSRCRRRTFTAAGISDKVLANPAYVRRAPLLDGIDEFDADFFGFTPQAARMMDPQHRLFLQCAWHALEDAGYDPAQLRRLDRRVRNQLRQRLSPATT